MATLVITRTTWTDDDGSGTTGTVIQNSELQAIYAAIDSFAGTALKHICDGRMTLTTATGVTTADVTAATTVYFTPYKGNRIALYDGSNWNLYTFSEISIALGSDAANTNYDLFAYNSSGTVTLERLAWTNDTTRATALVLQDGIYVKSGATTRRYLGTYRTTGSAGQTEDSLTKRYVWNYYHRVKRPLRRVEGTASWTYTTATYRQANASTSNQVDVVVGVAEVGISLQVVAQVTNTAANVQVQTSIGEDSTSSPVSGVLGQWGLTSVAAQSQTNYCQLQKAPAIGRHFYAWLEKSQATGTTTWFGNNADSTTLQAGIHGHIEG